MKPLLIFRHATHEGPGYFTDFLVRRGFPYALIRVDQHDPVPTSIDGVSGIAFMGGPMSVNDRLPWIPKVISLIQQAVTADIPVLGHCLGGQLMSKALGGTITPNRSKEIGWLPVETVESPLAREWLGELPPRFEVFHWHGETFSLPLGATPILKSRACRNQAFVLGKHLAFQCHIEMTPALVRSWIRTGTDEITHPSSTVQGPQRLRTNLAVRTERLHRVADVFYERWITGLKK